MEDQENQAPQKNRCSKCNSAFTYLRIKDGSLVCRSCGNVDLGVISGS